MKIYSEKEIIDIFKVEEDIQKTLDNIERYIFYVNKIDKVSPKLFLLMCEIQRKLYKCIYRRSAVLCFKDSLSSYKERQEERMNDNCDFAYVYKMVEGIESFQKDIDMTKKEMIELLNCYIDEHERIHYKTLENVYVARDMIVDELNEERINRS